MVIGVGLKQFFMLITQLRILLFINLHAILCLSGLPCVGRVDKSAVSSILA